VQAQAAQQQASHSQDHQALHSQVSPTSHRSRAFIASVVDRHRFDADPVRISMLMPIQIRIGIKKMPILRRILLQSFTYVGKSEILLLLVRALSLYNVLSSSSVSDVSYVFSILNSTLKFLEKSLLYKPFHLLEIGNDMDRPDPDQHDLDAVPDPDPAK
jgi:hypothetical protein